MNISDCINSVVAIATVVMAGATYYLAKVTGRLAKDAAEATKQADRRHQENQRPFCVIAFRGASETSPFGLDFDPELRQLRARAGVMNGQPSTPILVRGDLENKGAGPAKAVFIYLNARVGEGEDGAVRLTQPVLVSGLVAVGETAAIEVQITENQIIGNWDGEKWVPTQTSFQTIVNQAYEVVLQYEDVFGNIFRTIHLKGIWTPPIPDITDPKVRTQMMIRPNRPSPIFLTGRQDMRTLADVQTPLSTSTPADGQ